ncbi:MAG: tRNA (adenosine(37)-N6)-dimethylallyltransferase MiaA [Bacteroidales bacterium]|nr:tRNA (adenosine(37)-N6)-dimethylallyltransferase MiaA [Bacteroidales bacterium]MDD4684407.1 tRNA (adenosine(37)-N6)-dimethylallyltransferase MiaA [Bacteroidales bacterium]
MKKRLYVLVGPTAVGKTTEAISLANTLSTEILSADSRQFYKEMKIGVASPTDEELKAANHHFIGHISVEDKYNVGLYEKDALKKIKHLFETYDTLVLTGGSGMYVDVVCNGIDALPDVEKGIREDLNHIFSSQGILPLQMELKEKDPEYYAKVDTQNHIRLIRALEVIRQSSKPFSSFLTKKKTERDFEIIKFALHMDRQKLIERIHRRVDIMIEEGLVEEARTLYPFKNLSALNTVGYKEIFRYFDKEITLRQAIEDIKTNTRRYAKRQMTWFRKDKDIIWVEASNNINWKCLIENTK